MTRPHTEGWEKNHKLKLILNNDGNWISWEMYKDLHGIQEHGHYGDAINGDVVHMPKYNKFFIQNLVSSSRSRTEAYEGGRSEVVNELEKKISDEDTGSRFYGDHYKKGGRDFQTWVLNLLSEYKQTKI